MAINALRNEYLKIPSRNLKMSDFTIGQQKDLVLKLCLESPKNEASISDFKKILFPNNNADEIKYLLGLITESRLDVLTIRESRWDINLKTNEKTKPFLNNGGFSKIEQDLLKLTKKEDLKESLDIEIKILQKDNLKYQKTIREQKERIRNLDEQIKFISLIKLYWWLIPTCISIGIFLAEIAHLIME